jgi:uncharacterized membrane protein (DUF2068 family)
MVGIALIVGGSFVGALFGPMINSQYGGVSLGFLVGILGAVFFLLFAALAFVAGYGIWAMREWGRILTIVLASISLLFALPGLMFMMMPTHFFFGGFGVIRIAISVLMIWYLVQPQVRASFQQRSLVV